ncbi:MAG: hypothetical protein HY225_02810 [Candidatus Vogelbacteria bacterium]|nr:hypothetical protein [Candidatus Vogelbacteria bacterium]
MKNHEQESDPVIGVIRQMRYEGFTVKHIAKHMLRAGFDLSNFTESLEEYILKVSSPIN